MTPQPINILVAYPYFDQNVHDLLVKRAGQYRLIVDSGAFTAWNLGKRIKVDDYVKFLDSIKHLRPFHCVQLDVFGNPVETWKNYQLMLDQGVQDVMPVFTRGDTIERLNQMYEETDYIMFGGIVTGSKNKNYVKWFLGENGTRKAHWLGFVNMPFIKQYRPESVDSSSWQSAGRYGNVAFYAGHGMLKNVGRLEFREDIKKQVLIWAARTGFTPKEVAYLKHQISWVGTIQDRPSLANPQKGLAYFMGCVAHLLRSIDVENGIGTKIYLSAAGKSQLEMIFHARDFLLERGLLCAPSRDTSFTAATRSTSPNDELNCSEELSTGPVNGDETALDW